MTHEERIMYHARMHADKLKQGVGDERSEILYMTEAEVTCAAVADAIRSCKLIPISLINKDDIEQYLFDNGFVPAKEGGQDEK